jgi:hypothetical protein
MSTTNRKESMKTEKDRSIYHEKATEAACVERRTNEENITSQRLAKLYADAGACWAAAAVRSNRVETTYAHRRFEFCRAALVRLGRADLVEQLDALA